jgi:DNA processing protein
MMLELSPNTQAILLLSAPLIVGRGKQEPAPLTLSEYRRLARALHDLKHQPADLLEPQPEPLLQELARVADPTRLEALLARGFLLTQALERWRSRAIWVTSRADPAYPRRLKARLREDAPPVIYGCGEASLLESGGLAVVGSRHVDEEITAYTESIGRLAAEARRNLISGGARGIDQAAMRGSLEAGGTAVGILADSLEKQAVRREHRALLMEDRLVLISPYDPAAGFNVGHAMQRNKLIYALADAALVVSADYNKGGTWAGAVEQLEKLKFVPVFVRESGTSEKGLDALRAKGAHAWPQLRSGDALEALLEAAPVQDGATVLEDESQLSFSSEEAGAGADSAETILAERSDVSPEPRQTVHADDAQFSAVREQLSRMDTPQGEQQIAERFGVTRMQARKWLHRLVEEGVLEKMTRPRVLYRARTSVGTLFDI